MSRHRGRAPARPPRWISLAVVALALAGCSSEQRLSASTFREKANHICATGAAARSALAERYRDDIATYQEKARALQAKLLDQLNELNPPANLDDAYSRLLADAEDIASGDTVAEQAFGRFRADASELGLDECAGPSEASSSPTPRSL